MIKYLSNKEPKLNVELTEGTTLEETIAIAKSKLSDHPDYDFLTARLIAHDLHKKIPLSFSKTIKTNDLYRDSFVAFVEKHAKVLDAMVKKERDFLFTYMGINTLIRSYLLRDKKGKIVETPQYLYLRVAVGLWHEDTSLTEDERLVKIRETYDATSLHYFTHATPIMYNTGLKHQGLISCFIQALKEDSIKGIASTWYSSALYHKACGGIATWIHNLRAKSTLINQSNMPCDGIKQPLQIFEAISTYIDQGRKRPGSHAIYLSPHHLEIFTFLDMCKPHGKIEDKSLNLFFALWIPDYFFECVMNNKNWYLMCPNQYPGLDDVYGEEFVKKYKKYISQARTSGKIINLEDNWFHGCVIEVSARRLFEEIIKTQIESGMPYLLSKDAINRKSNQKNIGMIKASNLCAEITLVSTPEETATCCLASVKVSKFYDGKIFNWNKLHKIVGLIVECLNRVLDINDYCTEESKCSSLRHRPIGIGVQDLAGLYYKCDFPYDSRSARELNVLVQENMYYAALEKSCELARKYGAYEQFHGSPASQGILQFDMWKVEGHNVQTSLDWQSLKEKIKKYGLRNSTLMANMPTASSAHIIGSFESFEPPMSNIFVRKVLSDEYFVINSYLIKDLEKIGLWNKEMKERIIIEQGSIQRIKSIPSKLKAKYKTIHEIGMKEIIDQRADAGPFCCQSQSMNVYPKVVDFTNLYSIYIYGWRRGLKTLCYYMRSKAAIENYRVINVCSLDSCESCSA